MSVEQAQVHASDSAGRVDLLDLAGLLKSDDRAPLLALVRSAPPILQDERRGLWFANSHALCDRILRDARFSSDSRNATVVDGGTEVSAAFGGSELPIRPNLFFDPPPYALGRPFLFADPPDHTRLRRLVAKAFTPKVVAGLQPKVEDLVDELLEKTSTEFDLIEALAYPLPLRIIMDLLGIDERHYDFVRQWGGKLAGVLDADTLRTPEQRDEARHAQFHLAPFFDEQVQMRRRRPGPDLLSALVQAEDQGDSLSPFELIAMSLLLLLAGYETTVNLIGNGALALSRHHDELQALCDDPGLANAAVEETLRFDPPVQVVARTALEDVEVDGITVPAGGHVALILAAANRDPAKFAAPDWFDIRREDREGHLGFGFGLHHCLGAPLARVEAAIALRELASRFPDLTIEEPVSRRDDVVLRGATALIATRS